MRIKERRDMIKLPAWKWFENENGYSGSRGTDHEKGCINKDIFRYIVEVKDFA